MSARNILYLSEILGRDRPEIKRMVQTAMLNPEIGHIIERNMLLEIRKRGYDLTDLPLFSLNLSENVENGGISLGTIIRGKKRAGNLYNPLESYESHTLITGITTSGKSTLAKAHVPQFVDGRVWPVVFDNENEYGVLMKILNPEDVLVLDRETDKDNLFEPPPGCDPRVWLAKVINLMREVFYFRDGTVNLLFMILNNLFMNRGIYSGSENYPTVLDVANFLDTMEFKSGTRHYGYLESLKNRFRGELLESMSCVLVCRKGYPQEKLGNKCRIYRTKGLSDGMRNFYICLKMTREMTYRESFPPEGLKTVFIVDEAHKLYNKEIARRHDLGEPMVFTNARTFAKRGIACMYIDQIPSELPPPLVGNVNNLFVQRLTNGKDIKSVSDRMNLDPERREFLPVIPPRQWLLQSSHFPDPVLFEMPELRFEYVPEEEINRHMEKILPTLEYVPVIETIELSEKRESEIPGAKTKSGARPNKLWTEIAKILAEIRWTSLTDLYANLGNVSPWFARKIVTEMEKQEMIETCPISFGTRGNPKTFVVIKPKGAEFIGVKYDDVRLQGRGNTEHIIVQNLLFEVLKDSGKNVMVEYSANGKSVDIAEIREDKSIAYEIELSPSHPHVADNVLKDLEAGFDEVVVITRNQTGQNEARDGVHKNVGWEKLSRIKFKLLREFM